MIACSISSGVKSGKYFGWDDPRTWSLQSLNRRGFKPEAIRNFILSFGVNEHESMVSIDKFYSENRKLIDPDANRYFLVEEPVEIEVERAPEREVELRFFIHVSIKCFCFPFWNLMCI